jgi:hypothetical protein
MANSKAVIVAFIAIAVATTSTTLLYVTTTDVFAPSGRRWVPAVGDTLTYDNGIFNSKMEPNYPIDYASCLVTENTTKEGMISMNCQIYAPEEYKPQ